MLWLISRKLSHIAIVVAVGRRDASFQSDDHLVKMFESLATVAKLLLLDV